MKSNHEMHHTRDLHEMGNIVLLPARHTKQVYQQLAIRWDPSSLHCLTLAWLNYYINPKPSIPALYSTVEVWEQFSNFIPLFAKRVIIFYVGINVNTCKRGLSRESFCFEMGVINPLVPHGHCQSLYI